MGLMKQLERNHRLKAERAQMKATKEAKRQTQLLEQIARQQASAAPPGWYTGEDGARRYWNGSAWV